MEQSRFIAGDSRSRKTDIFAALAVWGWGWHIVGRHSKPCVIQVKENYKKKERFLLIESKLKRYQLKSKSLYMKKV